MPKLLKFVPKSHAILRQTMPLIHEFNTPLLQQIIADMCYSILPAQLKKARGAHQSAAGMAANQWGLNKRIFIFTPDGAEEDKPLQVMINPSYRAFIYPSEKSPRMEAAYEGCFSVPLTTGYVERYAAIMATYFTPQGELKECYMEGWEARVFQHETDHLDGKLFDGVLDQFKGPCCLERIIFKNKQEMQQFWQQN